ncbi:unnamed protein product, partial [Cylicostephanus goldi]
MQSIRIELTSKITACLRNECERKSEGDGYRGSRVRYDEETRGVDANPWLKVGRLPAPCPADARNGLNYVSSIE